MKPIELESWALRILGRVENKTPIEDSLVELKSEWPPPTKVSRQIAGHANAARGDEILWLIGVDESRGIIGADYAEVSNWFSAVRSNFNDIAPGLHHLNVTFKDKTVAALCFDTSRAPFVVKNPAFGQPAAGAVELEVPWREGTKTRSATRNDLIKLVAPPTKLPKLEILDGKMEFKVTQSRDESKFETHFILTLYVVPLNSIPIIFPFHMCFMTINGGGHVVAPFIKVKMDTPTAKWKARNRSRRAMLAHLSSNPVTQVDVQTGGTVIEATSDEIFIRGPGKIEIEGEVDSANSIKLTDFQELELCLSLTEAVSELKTTLTTKMVKDTKPSNSHLWHLKSAS
jgi:hypothetical protein